jgi:hypothetical protein
MDTGRQHHDQQTRRTPENQQITGNTPVQSGLQWDPQNRMATASGQIRDGIKHTEPLPRVGGQKGRQANHIALQKEMKYTYARLRKHNIATMDSDAKACYNRMIMSLATIVSGHFGLPRNTRKLQAIAIRAMQFHI